MMNKTIFVISITISLVFIVGNVSAALPGPSAQFEIDFSQINLPQGDWNLYIIQTGIYSSNEDFKFLIEDYIST